MFQSETIPIRRNTISLAPASTTHGAILLVQILIFIVAAALAVAPPNFFWKDTDLIYPWCVLILLHGCWVLWSWRRLRGTLLDPYVFIFLSALFFNAGQPMLEVFGLNKAGMMDGQFTGSVLARTVFLALAGLAGLHCGALLAIQRAYGQRQQSRPGEAPIQPEVIRVIGWSLLALSALPLTLQLKEAISMVQSSGYFALFQQELKPAGFGSAQHILAEFVVSGALFLIAGSDGRRLVVRVSALVLLLYTVIMLFLGSRQTAMQLVGAAWLWDRCVRRLPRAILLGASTLLLIVVFPMVRETRMAPGAERTSVSYVVNAYSSIQNPAVEIITEMGKTMMTIAHSLEVVPAERPHEWGVEYAYALLTVVPSLFWDRHPTMTYGVPTFWLIEMVDPYTARQGGTIGYSFIAEAYLNFGLVGVPLVTLLMGYALIRFFLWAERANTARLAMVAIFLPHLMFYARAALAEIPRALVWYCLIPYAACVWLQRRQRRAQA